MVHVGRCLLVAVSLAPKTRRMFRAPKLMESPGESVPAQETPEEREDS